MKASRLLLPALTALVASCTRPTPQDSDTEDSGEPADSGADTEPTRDPVFIDETWLDVGVADDASATVTCALTGEGRIQCWGPGASLYGGYPTETGHTQLGVADRSACALDATGRVVCWSSLGAAELPTEPLSLLRVRSGGGCGLRASDASVVCWDVWEPPYEPVPGQRFVDVAASQRYGCAVEEASGLLRCWGDIPLDEINGWRPIPPVDQGPFVEVALSESQQSGCVVRSDGVADCWGYVEGSAPALPVRGIDLSNDLQACGIGPDDKPVCWADWISFLPDPPDVPIQKLALGGDHACAVMTDARLVCWGVPVLP